MISFMNESTPDLHNRSVSFDIKIEAKCLSYSGLIFIVEMQKARQKNHTNRCIFYGARELYKMGGNKFEGTLSNEYYVRLCPVKVITIVDFDVKDDLQNTEDYLVHWDIAERSSTKVASNLLSWTFVVLPQFTKRLAKEPTTDFTGRPLEAWLNLFTMTDQATVMVTPEMTAHDAPLADGFRRVSQLNKDEIEAIEIDSMAQADLWGVMAAKEEVKDKEHALEMGEKDKEHALEMEEKDKEMEEKGKEHALEMALLKEEIAAFRRGKSSG